MARFRIIPDSSRVWIDMRTNLHGAHVETSGLEGILDVELAGGRIDPATPPAAGLELAVDRLRSDNPLFERELQRRVDARRHPLIVGELRSMRELDHPGWYAVEGDLTFHGITRRVRGEMRLLVEGDDAIQLDGEQVFDIRDFGIDPPRLLMLKADPEVKVRVSLAARRDPPTTARNGHI
jgi:polyisoprenoid-binding protein YceI